MVHYLLSKAPPLTEYEKLRARNMMRNNQRLQAVGLARVGSMLRCRNEFEEVSGVTNDDADYFPKEGEDNDGEEVGDSVVEKPVVKVCNLCLVWDVWESFVCYIICLSFYFMLCFLVLLTCDLMLLSLMFMRGPEV